MLVAPGGLDGEVVFGGGPLAAAGAAALGHSVLFLGLLRVEALSRPVNLLLWRDNIDNEKGMVCGTKPESPMALVQYLLRNAALAAF